jgi:hypothetical protein
MTRNGSVTESGTEGCLRVYADALGNPCSGPSDPPKTEPPEKRTVGAAGSMAPEEVSRPFPNTGLLESVSDRRVGVGFRKDARCRRQEHVNGDGRSGTRQGRPGCRGSAIVGRGSSIANRRWTRSLSRGIAQQLSAEPDCSA